MSLNEFSPKYLRISQQQDAVIVDVGVSLLTEEVNIEQFGHELFALVEQFGCRKLVVNMGTVQLVTSAGLGKMITLHRKMHRHKGQVIFCHLTKPVEDVLETSRLITYLVVTPNVETALNTLQSA